MAELPHYTPIGRGKALLVFAYANRHADAAARLHEIHKALEAARQGRERTPDEIHQQREKKRQDDIRKQQANIERSEILLAEHIISNAIWLKENEFAERFQAALSDATAELANSPITRTVPGTIFTPETARRA